MSEEVYVEALKNTQRRLSQSRIPTLHTLLFGVLGTVVGLYSLSTADNGIMDGRLYWGIFLWSIAVAIHNAVAYWRSGARTHRRELIIQQELMKLAYAYDLSTDEVVDLHQRLSEDIRQRSHPFLPLMIASVGSASLWVGTLLMALILYRSTPNTLSEVSAALIGQMIQSVPVVGMAIITLLLSVTFFLQWTNREDLATRDAHLYALYSKQAEKRKHIAGTRLAIDDEGELVLSDVQAARQTTKR